MDLSDIIKGFSDGGKRIITSALLSAKELGHTYVGSEHILLGVLRESESVPAKLLNERNVSYDAVKSRIIGLVGMGCRTSVSTDDMTPIARRILLHASVLADGYNSSKICPEHILMALFGEECVAVRIIEQLGNDADEIYNILEELYGNDAEEELKSISQNERRCGVKKICETPLLDANSQDLTEKARSFGVDPVIGREKEEERLIAVLLRRRKNNPCLVGEAGVGKTAIVESLASRIVRGDVPDELKNKRIMSLELSMVVAGTKYRGEFEEKIKNIIAEVIAAGDIILFIDEIHTIVGAGGAEGAIDASNILKPALARGEIRLIGATTRAEFRESIEKDKALERRFQPINVCEPCLEDCLKMLAGLKNRYEEYHGVTICDSALEAAVRLSSRYITDRFLPDKAIDLIDEAAAFLKLCKKGKNRLLTENEIASAAEKHTGIPVSRLNGSELERLCGLEDELKKYIIGQDRAINAVCSAVRRSRCGVRSGNRPNASFLFIGGTGVGKTECAKRLAGAVFDRENAFIRLDMSEFSEPNSVSKIIGAPPGYVGYSEGNPLSERVRRNPYSLLLFDGAETAHPDVRALLLQILDEGKLTDSSGLTVDFGNTMVIMTARLTGSASGIGFSREEEISPISAAKQLAPDIAERVDEVVMFRDLGKNELCDIVNARLCDFCAHIKHMGINASPSCDFAEKAVAECGCENPRVAVRYAVRLAEEAVSGILLANGEKECEITIFIENGRGTAKIKQKSY